MNQVNHTNSHEAEHKQFTSVASDLGLKPGVWSGELPTVLGDKQPFIRHSSFCQGDNLLWVDYRQGNGCIELRVFND